MTIWRLGVVAASKSVGVTVVSAGFAVTRDTNLHKMPFADDTWSITNTSVGPFSGMTGISLNAAYVTRTVGPTNEIQKYPFPTQTFSVLPATLPFANSDGGNINNPPTAGYLAGGYSTPTYPNNDTQIRKIQFSNDSGSLIPATLPIGRYVSSLGSSENSSIGYLFGGIGGGNPAPLTNQRLSNVTKLTFSSETVSNLPTGLSTIAQHKTAFRSSTHAYAAGGGSPLGAPAISTVDKFAFSNDARSTLPVGLSVAVNSGAAFSSPTHGYKAGGEAPVPSGLGPYVLTTDKFSFSDDSRSAGTNLPAPSTGTYARAQWSVNV